MPYQLSIQCAQKTAPRFSERTVPVEETLSRARAFAVAKGVTRLADITGLDRVGIPVFSAVVPKSDDSLTVYNGKGHSSLDARAGALMESIERQTALDSDIEIVTGSYAKLRHGVHRVIDPELFNHRLTDDYTNEKSCAWVHGYDLIAEETVLAPACMGGFGRRFWGPGSPFVAHSSNGLASGNCVEEAVCHGLCELVERDAWTLAELQSRWIPMAKREARLDGTENVAKDDNNIYPCIDLSAAGWPITELMHKFAQADLRPVVRDISSDFGIACIIASAADTWTPGYPQAHSGLGAHPNARIAVVRALTELAQSRAVDIQGVREDILPAEGPPHEHGRHTQRLKRLDQTNWMLRNDVAARPLADVPSVEHDDVAVDIRQIISGLRSRGIQSAIVIDLTEPGGFPVVRVTIPGLEFWVMDNGKLGQRAVRFWKQHTAIA